MSPTFFLRVRTSREHRARRSARFPSGVTRSCHLAEQRRKPRHGKHPPGERVRVSRTSDLSRRASGDWLAARVVSHFASHAPAEPDPALPAAPVFAVSVPSRFRATQQVAKKNRDSLAPSSERAAVAFVRSTVEVRASAPGYHPDRVAGVSRARTRSRGPPPAPFRARTPRAMKRKCSQERFPRGIEALAPLSAHADVRENARRGGPHASTRARDRIAAADPALSPLVHPIGRADPRRPNAPRARHPRARGRRLEARSPVTRVSALEEFSRRERIFRRVGKGEKQACLEKFSRLPRERSS